MNKDDFKSGILEMMSGGMEDDDTSPEELLAQLEESAKHYADSRKECPFKVGDFVHPRKGYGIKGRGKPHIIVDVRNAPDFNFTSGDSATPAYGQCFDIRVVCRIGKHTCFYWLESHAMEPFQTKAKVLTLVK